MTSDRRVIPITITIIKKPPRLWINFLPCYYSPAQNHDLSSHLSTVTGSDCLPTINEWKYLPPDGPQGSSFHQV